MRDLLSILKSISNGCAEGKGLNINPNFTLCFVRYCQT